MFVSSYTGPPFLRDKGTGEPRLVDLLDPHLLGGNRCPVRKLELPSLHGFGPAGGPAFARSLATGEPGLA